MSTPKKETKTPIKSRRLTNTPLSPTPRTPTVDSSIKRRVSDILVNFHKFIQTWELNNQSSFNSANTLSNLYTQWTVVKDSNDLNEIMSDECKRLYHTKLLKTREDLLKQLKEHQSKLKVLLSKMNGLLVNMRAIYYLGLVANNNGCFEDDDSDQENSLQDLEPVVFSTWPTEKFLYTMQIILSQYTKEYLLKMKFYNIFLKYRVNKADAEDTNLLTQCISVWLHQPYIGDHCRQHLEAMLVEAELK